MSDAIDTIATYASLSVLVCAAAWFGADPLESALRKWEARRQMNPSSQSAWRLSYEPTYMIRWLVAAIVLSIIVGATLKHQFGVDSLASGLAIHRE